MLGNIKTLITRTLGRKVQSDFERAMELFSEGKYDRAEKEFRVIYRRQFDQQFDLGKRIHLGASLHMIGLCSLFQRKFEEAFKNFLLAYISDTFNVDPGHEDEADRAPAYQVLKGIFKVSNLTFNLIKEKAKSKPNHTKPIDIKNFLNEFMPRAEAKTSLELLNNTKLIDKYGKYTTLQLLRRFLMTPRGKKALDEAVQTFEMKVLQRVAEIAKKRAYQGQIREKDMKRVLDENSFQSLEVQI